MRVSSTGAIINTILLLFSSAVWADPPIQDSHIQVLAASCAACHGTNGNHVGGDIAGKKSLAGMQSSYFVEQMLAFRSGVRASTVMHRHAKGLTPAEIEELGQYFSAQPSIAARMPKRAQD